MHTHEEKINLLSEMIAFAIVDGQLHQREYDFLALVACELRIDKTTFDDLFHQELPVLTIKSQFQRIQQFYRLALLMHCDGILHEKEETAIRQIAITMGLNPFATKRILEKMKASTNCMISGELLLEVFQEQYN